MADQRTPQQQAVIDAYKVLYDNDARAAKALLKELGDQYHQQALSHFEEFRRKMTEAGGFKGEAGRIGWKIGDQIGMSVLGDLHNLAGGTGGLGEAANEIGKTLGDAIGAHVTSDLGKKLAQFGGVSIEMLFRGFGIYESLRMAGARLTPMITAGRGGSGASGGDFARAGQTAISRIAEIQQHTGASQEAVVRVLTELSRVGIAFDETGRHATQYVLAADMVMNLDPGTAEKMTSTLIREYGESWEDVKTILDDVRESTMYWDESNKENASGLALSLSGRMNAVSSYQALQQTMRGTNVDMLGLNKVMLSFRDVMGGIGIRPAAMTATMAEFFKGVMPHTDSVADTALSSFALGGFLRGSTAGQEELKKISAYAREHNIDPKFWSIALDQLMGAKGGIDTQQHVGNVLVGIANEKATYEGDAASQNAAMQFKLQRMGYVSNTRSAYLAMAFSDALKKVMDANPQMSMDKAMKLAGKDPNVLAQIPPDKHGIPGEEVVKQAMGMGAAALSTERKIELAVERMKPLDWVLYGRPDRGPGGKPLPGHEKPPSRSDRHAAAKRAEHHARRAQPAAGAPPTAPGKPGRKPGRTHPVSVIFHPIAGGARQVTYSVAEGGIDPNDPMFVETARRYDLPPGILEALVEHESHFDPQAQGFNRVTGQLGAKGLAQVTLDTGKQYGLTAENRTDPRRDLDVGAHYLSSLVKRNHGDIRKALMQYGGPTAEASYADAIMKQAALGSG